MSDYRPAGAQRRRSGFATSTSADLTPILLRLGDTDARNAHEVFDVTYHVPAAYSGRICSQLSPLSTARAE